MTCIIFNVFVPYVILFNLGSCIIYLHLRSYDISFVLNISFINVGFRSLTDLKTSVAMVFILLMCKVVYPHQSNAPFTPGGDCRATGHDSANRH